MDIEEYYHSRLLYDVSSDSSVPVGNSDNNSDSRSHPSKAISVHESAAVLSLYARICDACTPGNSANGLAAYTEAAVEQAKANYDAAESDAADLARTLASLHAHHEQLQSCIDRLASSDVAAATHAHVEKSAQWVDGAKGKLNVVTMEVVKDTYASPKAVASLSETKARLEAARAAQKEEMDKLAAVKAAYTALPASLLAELQALQRKKAYLVGALQNLA